ncbi:MAG TPA: BlaI/MecI/CopY family transcriptional regulator [Thermoanaerobaculia bacterium]|jgi:predicted transcriptional regulator|nr:BlaI/MecI/CopY family transcriptional regulator [Thermoanaerobaculia bacterium]
MSETHLLTDLQLAVMRVLWERGEASVVEIWEALRPERGLAQTTVATLLSRLEKRGAVTHRREARQFVYRPEVSEPEVRRVMVRELTARLFAGDVTALVSHLLAAREVSPGDLAKVKQLIDEQSAAGEKEPIHARD